MCVLTMPAAGYARQLADWSLALAAARFEAVVPDLAPGSGEADVRRFLANSIGERHRMLADELEFLALAFDDFETRLERYLAEVPRSSGPCGPSDAQRFVAWLRRQSRLSAKQRDFLACQDAEYACLDLGRRMRTAHLEFQGRRSDHRRDGSSRWWEAAALVYCNPIHVWTHLAVAARAPRCDADNNAPSLAPNDDNAVFYADGQQIRSFWPAEHELAAVKRLTEVGVYRVKAWLRDFREIDAAALRGLGQRLIEGGLIVAR